MLYAGLITDEEIKIAKPAVKAVLINNENKILIITQNVGNKKVLDLPGGKNDGEPDIDALIRELKEELGLEVDKRSELKFVGTWFFKRVLDGKFIKCNTYAYRVANILIDINNNPAKEIVSEYKWLSKNEFNELEDSDYLIPQEMFDFIKSLNLE